MAALSFCYAFFHRVAPSVMIDPSMRDLGVGGAVLGNLSAFYFYAYASPQIPVGMLHDRWGPRRVLTCAALFAAAGSLLFAIAETVLAIYLGRLMIGAGAAFGFVGTLKLASTWFPTRRFAMLDGARIYSTEAYRGALSVLVVFLLLGLAVCFLARETRQGATA